MKISSYIIYLEMQPNALLLRQNFDLQKVSVIEEYLWDLDIFSTRLVLDSALPEDIFSGQTSVGQH
jgi:hypothetical protein